MNLDQIDLHIHAGIERPVPLDVWIDGLIQAGRRTLGFLDHYELYLRSDAEYRAYLERKGFPAWYSNGVRGFREFCDEVRAQTKERSITALLGLEIYHGDFPQIDVRFLAGLDVIGRPISKTGSFAPWSDCVLQAAAKLRQVAHETGLVGVLFHPFAHSFWAYRQGTPPPRGLNIVEPDRLDAFADRMATFDICIEINWGSDSKNLTEPLFLERYRPVTRVLKERGVPFWLGSDVHHSSDAPYEMRRLCTELGIDAGDVWVP